METLLPQIAFGYGRVSTAKQGLSREAQTETVHRATSRYTDGAADTAHEMFFNEDTTGGIPFAERPSGRLLLIAVKAALAAGGSPTIIVAKVHRLSRDTVDVSQTVSLFESLGARIVFLDINVDRHPMTCGCERAVLFYHQIIIPPGPPSPPSPRRGRATAGCRHSRHSA
jgi:DNA invertase Pin-like site-specific DNA recombinase